MFLATGPRNILGSPNFFKEEYLSKFFVAKMKTSVILNKNYHIGYAFVNRKNRNLRPNLLLTLRATFSKIRGPLKVSKPWTSLSTFLQVINEMFE